LGVEHKQNRKYKDKQHKFTYIQQHERLQNPKPKKHKRSVETEKQKGKRPASGNENLAQFSTPTKRSRLGPKSHAAEDHRKDSKSKKRSHTAINNREPIQDKLFTTITNKVNTMIKNQSREL
jgi:hypothetical protein